MTDETLKSPENDKEQRRPLTREEREAMKRELKAQLRAYVDALKEQMLGKKGEGRPELEEAMAKAEREAERRMAEGLRGGADGGASRNAPADQPRGGVLAAIAAAGAKAASAKSDNRESDMDAMKTETPQTEPARDVLDVSDADGKGTGGEPARTTDSEASPAEASGSAGNVVATEDETSGEGPESAIPKEELERLTRDIIAALKTVYDPEIPVDIYELGLVYRIDIADDRTVTIDMTLTAPGCPVAGDMPGWVQKAVSEVEGVKDVKVNLVFDPPWDMSRMSDEARLALNMF